MLTAIARLLQTDMFKFLVGPEGKAFYIHRSIVAELSKSLKALVSNGMKESQEGCADWKQVDEDIFLRFAQYAYTGAYADFEPEKKPLSTANIMSEVVEMLHDHIEAKKAVQEVGSTSHPPQSSASALPIPGPPNAIPPSATHFFGFFDDFLPGVVRPLDCVGTNEKKDAFRLPYSLASYRRAASDWLDGQVHSRHCKRFALPPPPAPHTNPRQLRVQAVAYKRKIDAISCDCDSSCDGAPSPKKRDFIEAFMAKAAFRAAPPVTEAAQSRVDAGGAQCFEPVFLGHARLWVFADLYGITGLMDAACGALVAELGAWQMERATFVKELGALARYVYEEGRTADGCQLRLLVAQFVACVVEDVQVLDEWEYLIGDVPELAVDLMRQMTNRFG
jgi:hypothetical protein